MFHCQMIYGSLSTKAMRKIHPYIKENKFSTACELAGYRHSKHSLTKEENDNRVLRDSLEVFKKNSLRQTGSRKDSKSDD
ncbi:hypothetical protein CCAN2_1700003 [Capnocytophaga canimorsus]|nr:hypothetical protein CCAN2_1700003 [Capnocytophaga canimorsus]